MNENVFREILGESLRREFAEFDNAPEHKFSLKHRLAMKYIFARYEKNSRSKITGSSAQSMPHYRLKQKIIIALVIVILMTLITGWFFPLHRITEAQINWLRSRYDFPNMLISTPMQIEPNFNIDDSGYGFVGMWRTSDDYINFLSDLEDLGIYTSEETHKLLRKSEPIDTRPVDPQSGQIITEEIKLTALIAKQEAETPLSSVREFVSRLEHQIGFYTERSKDKARAVEGDAEFAALISEHYLPLQKSFLELLEKLYAESSDDDSSDDQSNILLVLDKDDRRYLFNINELEKC